MTTYLPILEEPSVQTHEEEKGLGALATAQGLLPLQAVEIKAHLTGLVGQCTLEQTFCNVFPQPLEATYIFPLPDRAAVTAFRMQVGERIVEGVLKERGQARQEYTAAVQQGRQASIAEEDRPGVFTMRVGNIMPGEEARVTLTLVGPLLYDQGEATFRFPLVVAPRYIPGASLPGAQVGTGTAPDTAAVPDASRISPPVLLPGFPNPVRLAIAVTLQHTGLPISNLRSSLPATLSTAQANVQTITVHPGARLDRDFILRYRLAEQSVRTSLVLQADAHQADAGTFLLTLLPPQDAPMHASKPREIVFVLDRSGSMEGWKLNCARRALARMVDTLSNRDRFTVYAFDDQIQTPWQNTGIALRPASDRHRFQAVEFLSGLKSGGGTEMAQPLDLAVQQLANTSAEHQRILVLVTDGQIGNEDQILRNLASRVHNLRLVTLGIDQAVNEAFLKRLAQLGGGFCELVESEERLDEVLQKIHRRIDAPVLTGVTVEAPLGGKLELDKATVVPSRVPDLFTGAPLFLMGRYRGPAPGSALLVRGHDLLGHAWSETVPSLSVTQSALAHVWARAQVRELEDRYVSDQGDKRLLEKQILRTSLDFGVLCRFTAYVAIDSQRVVNPTGQMHQVTQAVEPAAGWAMLGTQECDEEAEVAAVGSFGFSVAGQGFAGGGGKMRKQSGMPVAAQPIVASTRLARLPASPPVPLSGAGDAASGLSCDGVVRLDDLSEKLADDGVHVTSGGIMLNCNGSVSLGIEAGSDSGLVRDAELAYGESAQLPAEIDSLAAYRHQPESLAAADVNRSTDLPALGEQLMLGGILSTSAFGDNSSQESLVQNGEGFEDRWAGSTEAYDRAKRQLGELTDVTDTPVELAKAGKKAELETLLEAQTRSSSYARPEACLEKVTELELKKCDERMPTAGPIGPSDDPLIGYRRRAYELHSFLVAQLTEAERRQALPRLVHALSILVEDLQSTGANDAVEPLADLLAQLKLHTLASQASLDFVWTHASQVLLDFSQATTTELVAQGRSEFWK